MYKNNTCSIYNTNVITLTEKEKVTISGQRTTRDGGGYNLVYRLF